jgi:hypothetical protein
MQKLNIIMTDSVSFKYAQGAGLGVSSRTIGNAAGRRPNSQFRERYRISEDVAYIAHTMRLDEMVGRALAAADGSLA